MSMYDKTNPDQRRWHAEAKHDRKEAEQERDERTHAQRGAGVPPSQWPDELEQVYREGMTQLRYAEGKKRMKRLLLGTGLKG